MPAFDSLSALVERVAQATDNAPRAIWLLGAMVAALALGTVVRIVRQRLRPARNSTDLLASLITWWVLIAALMIIAALGRTGVVLGFLLLSIFALREFFRLLPVDWIPRPVALAAWLVTALQYLWIWIGWERMFLLFVPLASLAFVSAVRMAAAPPSGFMASTGAVQWALMISVYGLSHAACFHTLPASSNRVGGALGWLLYLLLVTEVNDMAQAFCGRAFGSHKATPHISPNKTWEGFIGGVLATIALACLLAPAVTPLTQTPPAWKDTPLANASYMPAILAGTIIALGGIVGDLLMSSCKRDRGVKDFGTLLPGQGGVLDRFDSLTITAPLFYHLVRWLDY